MAQDLVEQATRLFIEVLDHLGPNLQAAGHLVDDLVIEVLDLEALRDQPSDGLTPGSELASNRDDWHLRELTLPPPGRVLYQVVAQLLGA